MIFPAIVAAVPRANALLLPSAAWLILVKAPEANIRVDLLIIGPFMLVLTVWPVFEAWRSRTSTKRPQRRETMHRPARPIALLCAVVLSAYLAGCATTPAADLPAKSLAGTSWELLSIQSMDDAQGTTTIADPALYTLHFGADGHAAFRLNCNRGMSSWSAQAAGADSGRLSFGPIATTRALCPPPSVDERIVRDMAYVRSYLFADGKLHMSLFADGGIYSWRPSGQ